MTIPRVQPRKRIQPHKPPPWLEQSLAQRPKPIQQQILELKQRIEQLRRETQLLLKKVTRL